MSTGLGLYVRDRYGFSERYVEVGAEGTVRDVLKQLGVCGRLLFGGRRIEGSLADCGVCPESRLELVRNPWEMRVVKNARLENLWYDATECDIVMLRNAVSGVVLVLGRQRFRSKFFFHESDHHILRDCEFIMRGTWEFENTYSAVPSLGLAEAWPGVELQGGLREALSDMKEYSGQLGGSVPGETFTCGDWEIHPTDDGMIIVDGSKTSHWRPSQTHMVLDHAGFSCLYSADDRQETVPGLYSCQVREGDIRHLSAAATEEVNQSLGRFAMRGTPMGEEKAVRRWPTRNFSVRPPWGWGKTPIPLLEDWSGKGWEEFEDHMPKKKRFVKQERSPRRRGF